jgi:hypothetical protein
LARFSRPSGTALAGGCALAVAALTACSSGSSSLPAGPHTVSLSADGHAAATLDVLTGTSSLSVGTAHFGPGGSLLRVVTPPGDQAAQLAVSHPSGTAGTEVGLSTNGASAVSVTLNADVSWQLNLGGGATRANIDLRGGHVIGVTFSAGVSDISLALPQPGGSVPVRLAGGASVFDLSLPPGVPARVTAGGGAGEVSLLGQEHTGVAGGSAYATAGWAPGVAGFDIDASSGASAITVTARSS